MTTMTAPTAIPDPIRQLLDRAGIRLLQGSHGDASTLLWQAADAAIKHAAKTRGQTLRTEADMESFVDMLDAQVPPGFGLMAGYLNALEFQRNGDSDGDLLDFDDVVFYEPVIRGFVTEILELPV